LLPFSKPLTTFHFSLRSYRQNPFDSKMGYTRFMIDSEYYQEPVSRSRELLHFQSIAAGLEPGQDFPPSFYRNLSQFIQLDAALKFLVPKMELSGDEALLDLGCGEGAGTTNILLPNLPQGSVTGVDINPSSIANAVNSFSRDGLATRFLLGNIESLGDLLKSEHATNKEVNLSFDMICSNFTLHWPSNLGATFREMRKVISPGGRMVHLLSGKDPYPELFNAAHTVIRRPKWRDYFDKGRFRHPPLRDFLEVTSALRKGGFNLSSGGVQPVWHTFPNEITLASWMGLMPRPILVRIPENSRGDFGIDVVNEYKQQIASITDYPEVVGHEIAIRHNMILFAAKCCS